MLGTLLTRARWLAWTAFYRALGRVLIGRIGRGCWFEGWIDRPAFGGEIRLGDRVRICRGVEWSVPRGAKLTVGDGTFIGRGVVISAHVAVEIGRDCLLAEYACLHDNDHLVGAQPGAVPMFRAEPLAIGDRCWLGAQAIMVRGSGLGADCVLGAGAVLTTKLDAGIRAVGVPALGARREATR